MSDGRSGCTERMLARGVRHELEDRGMDGSSHLIGTHPTERNLQELFFDQEQSSL